MEKLVNNIVDALNARGYLKENHKDVIIYGLDILISTALTTILLVIIGFALHSPFDVVVYLVVTVPLRMNGGGYHAPTHISCTVLQCLSFAGAHFLAFFWGETVTLYVLLLALCIMIILIKIKAPVEHPNNPISDYYKPLLNRKATIWSFLVAVTCLLLFIGNYAYFATLIASSMLVSSISLLFGNK